MARWELNHHRKTVIRRESRVTHWLYAFVRGTPLKVIEPTRKELDLYHRNQLIKRAHQKCRKLEIPIEDFDRWLTG